MKSVVDKIKREHERNVLAVACSPDGRRIVTGGSDHTVRIWDAETGNELHCLRRHKDEVRCVAFSPDGGWIVSGAGGFYGDQLSPDTTVRIWDAETGAELHCLSESLFQVNSVAYTPDGRQIVCESWDGVRDEFYRYVWDAKTMKFLGVTEHLFGH